MFSPLTDATIKPKDFCPSDLVFQKAYVGEGNSREEKLAPK